MLEVTRIISAIEPRHVETLRSSVNRMKAMRQLTELSRGTRPRLRPFSRKRRSMTLSFAN